MRRKRNDMDFTRGHVKVSPCARKGALGANGAQVHVEAHAQRVGALNCIVGATVLAALPPSVGPGQMQGRLTPQALKKWLRNPRNSAISASEII